MIKFLARGFMWFTGVIEDRTDPEYLGRVKVVHRASHFGQITTNGRLPWSQVVLLLHQRKHFWFRFFSVEARRRQLGLRLL